FVKCSKLRKSTFPNYFFMLSSSVTEEIDNLLKFGTSIDIIQVFQILMHTFQNHFSSILVINIFPIFSDGEPKGLDFLFRWIHQILNLSEIVIGYIINEICIEITKN